MKTNAQVLISWLYLATAVASFGQPSPTLQFTVTSHTVSETDGSITLNVRRTGELEPAVTVDFATADGTATNGLRYTAVSNTLSFAAGETNQTIQVPILNTAFYEGLQWFQVGLTNPSSSAVLGAFSTATVTITDNDPGIQVELANHWVGENADQTVMAITRGPDEIYPATVDFATVNVTALAGQDYTATNGTLSFGANETRKLLCIPILNDTLRESAEYFRFTLSNPTGDGLGARRVATITIEDNDPGIQVEFTNYWAREDSGQVVIGVTRGEDENWPATVDFTTVNGSALAGQDYTATNGTLSFAADEHLILLAIPILNDGLRDVGETFRLTLSTPTGGSVLGAQTFALLTIEDNDPGVQFVLTPSPNLRAVSNWVYESEGTVTLTVARGNDTLLDPFSVQYTVRNGTATAGLDFLATDGVLEFAAGEMTRPLTIPIMDEGVAEPDERFQIVLSNPTGGLLLGSASTATVTICDATEMRPHRSEHVAMLSDGTARLTLGGGYTPGVGVVNRFRPFLDMYPVEVSGNLRDWSLLTWLVRTNTSATALTFRDLAAGSESQRFYRTPAAWLPTPAPPPTGPYAVGRIDRLLTDPSRRNRYNVSTNGSFMVAIWYPALPQAGGPLVRFEKEAICRSPILGEIGLAETAPYFYAYGSEGVPFATNVAFCPVVMASHGYLGVAKDFSIKAAELASHGYVVVEVDHWDCTGTVFPDGTFHYDNAFSPAGKPQTEAGLRDRARDFVFVLDYLAQDPTWAARVNPARAAAMGFSWGGAAAGEFCRVDSRCLAAISLDGGGAVSAALTTAGLQKPSLTVHNPAASESVLYDKALSDAIWFQVSGTTHDYFTDWYGTVAGVLPAAHDVQRMLNRYILWFLNKHLKDINDPMPPIAQYPRIINFRQK